jgi:hypothetical protein
MYKYRASVHLLSKQSIMLLFIVRIYILIKPSQLLQIMTFLNCIREISYSNVGRRTNDPA